MAKPMQARSAQAKWRDLREWLSQVEALGELKRVTVANSEEDIGAITEMLDHSEESPCVLFDEIPKFQRGFRVLANSMGSRKRQAVTLGIDPTEATHDRLLDFWRGMLKGFTPIPPATVKRGAVQENILCDDDVNLARFPAPIWHLGDGGRFIGTASINIMRDPDSGYINVGTYRNQVFDKNGIGIRAAPPHHGGVTPAALSTFPIVAISDFIVAVSCSGELEAASTPPLMNRPLPSGERRKRSTSWWRRATIAAGVPAGKNIACSVSQT